MTHNREYLNAIERNLKSHKIIGEDSTITNRTLKSNVLKFQEKVNIYTDGIIGPETLWELQFPGALNPPKMNWIKCDSDIIRGSNGYDNFLLREDAADLYNKLRNEIKEAGGLITSSGGKRYLSQTVNAHRSAKSMHYPGLAFDLALDSGFFNPEEDSFIVVKNKAKTNGYWKIYCKAQGGVKMSLKAVYWDSWNSGVDRTATISGNFLDFTALAQKHGFFPINPRKAFTRKANRKYLSSEWWHFQAEGLLIPGFSQFGIELLKIEDYSPNYIEQINSDVWNNKKSIFKHNWW
nr:hypothetical protein [uncultured Allomuricauda sp.]